MYLLFCLLYINTCNIGHGQHLFKYCNSVFKLQLHSEIRTVQSKTYSRYIIPKQTQFSHTSYSIFFLLFVFESITQLFQCFVIQIQTFNAGKHQMSKFGLCECVLCNGEHSRFMVLNPRSTTAVLVEMIHISWTLII